MNLNPWIFAATISGGEHDTPLIVQWIHYLPIGTTALSLFFLLALARRAARMAAAPYMVGDRRVVLWPGHVA